MECNCPRYIFNSDIPVIIGTLAPYTEPFLCKTIGLPRGLMVSLILILAFRTPIVSSNVIALILSDAKIASLSANVGSSLEGTLADKITHISQRLTLTALRSARLKGDP